MYILFSESLACPDATSQGQTCVFLAPGAVKPSREPKFVTSQNLITYTRCCFAISSYRRKKSILLPYSLVFELLKRSNINAFCGMLDTS